MTVELNGKLAPTVSDTEVQRNSLLEAIMSGEVLLNYSYLPACLPNSEKLDIDTTRFPLVDDDQDDDQSDELLLRTIDGLLDNLVLGVDPTKIPLADLDKTPERVIYL